jgi:hypothetical protein
MAGRQSFRSAKSALRTIKGQKCLYGAAASVSDDQCQPVHKCQTVFWVLVIAFYWFVGLPLVATGWLVMGQNMFNLEREDALSSFRACTAEQHAEVPKRWFEWKLHIIQSNADVPECSSLSLYAAANSVPFDAKHAELLASGNASHVAALNSFSRRFEEIEKRIAANAPASVWARVTYHFPLVIGGLLLFCAGCCAWIPIYVPADLILRNRSRFLKRLKELERDEWNATVTVHLTHHFNGLTDLHSFVFDYLGPERFAS